MKINTKVGDLEYQMINGRWVKLRHKKPHKKSSYEMLKQKNRCRTQSNNKKKRSDIK